MFSSLVKNINIQYNKYEKYNESHKEEKMSKSEGRYIWNVTVGKKGQIVIPKQAREIFDIKPGDNLIILADVEKGMAIPPKSQVSTILNNILGDEK